MNKNCYTLEEIEFSHSEAEQNQLLDIAPEQAVGTSEFQPRKALLLHSWIQWRTIALSLAAMLTIGCYTIDSGPSTPNMPHGQVASGISAPLGNPLPTASVEQLHVFEQGQQVALRRFALNDGLGPAFNTTFCIACHRRPTLGGSSGLYRNFFMAGTHLPDGSFIPARSAGDAGGVVRIYHYGPDEPARPSLPDTINVIAQRNPIPFYGVGLLAELSESEILSRADPDDEDGDGISGRANWDRGFVGRFGRKAQTVSIEGFLRGPLFNHLGITTDPLSEEQKGNLPVDSRNRTASVYGPAVDGLRAFAQAAAPDGPLVDSDGIPDPEMSDKDLFSLVSFAMLLAAPELEAPTEQTVHGAEVFDKTGCGSCHTPRLKGPRGPLHVYSDLLLHDMGEELADGIKQGNATGFEFRTQPLWGISAVGPYLHDGRAATIGQAVLLHAGEGQASRNKAAALSDKDFDDLIEFLLSLGGRTQYSTGLIPPKEPIAPPGEYGGPINPLSSEDEALFLKGREVFDRDFSYEAGVGNPGFNGDSCRSCHTDPVVGGAGPRGVNVIRQGILDAEGSFSPPSTGTMLHKQTTVAGHANPPEKKANVFEHRQPPSTFGLGLVDALPEEVIIANADPQDDNDDGISGRVSWTKDGRVGRFSWKAQVPSLSEFVRDAIGAELGMTLPYQPGLTFGATQDKDDISDPEFDLAEAEALVFYLTNLAPPPRQENPNDPLAQQGEEVFQKIGCGSCHIPALNGPSGPVSLYSDLLLHEILPPGAPGIASGSANMREFRTSPLWGIRDTAPYMHTGEADTIDEAINLHDGEASSSRYAYRILNLDELKAIMAFLNSL
ncbi:MAG: di-heme oxidoredictase family protein [SAR202 cluster bacterium]|jgi:CxxC motif-containing protein (DUF1111 family)|nr:di-heme oxidoredictase family protein [SAR202 cluster bacterium]